MADITGIEIIRSEVCTTLKADVNAWLQANTATLKVEEIIYHECIRVNTESAYLAIIHYHVR